MGALRNLIKNPMVAVLLATQGREGAIAATVLKSVDSVFTEIDKAKAGEVDMASLALAGGEILAEVVPLATEKTVVDDALQERFGVTAADAIYKLKERKAEAERQGMSWGESLKYKVRLAARTVWTATLGDLDDDDD